MKAVKLFCLLNVCLVMLSQSACGAGGADAVSDGDTAPIDQGQGSIGSGSQPTSPDYDGVNDSNPTNQESTIFNPTWQEIPESRLDQSDAYYDWSPNTAPGTGGQRSIMNAWGGAAFDTTRNRILIHGGGHGDYGGQEIYAFNFNDNTWSRPADPDTYASITHNINRLCIDRTLTDQSSCETAGETWDTLSSTCMIEAYEDKGSCQTEGYDWDCLSGVRTYNDFPKSVHTYDRLFYNESIDSMCDSRGSIGYGNCVGGPEMACYSFTTNEWSWDFNEVTIGGTGTAGAIDPVTGYFWIQGSGQSPGATLGVYDPVTDTWTNTNGDSVMGSTYPKNAIIDSSRNLFVLTHQWDIYAMPMADYRVSIDVSDYEKTLSGTGPDSGERWSKWGMAYDPVSQNIVVWDGGANIYLLDPDTWSWSSVTPTGDAPGEFPGNYNGTYGRLTYVESLDKFALVNSVSENVYLLDLRADSAVPETTFDLTSSMTDVETPFTTAVGFKKGSVTNKPTLSLDNYQAEVKKYWNDGSVKHAIFSGTYDSKADTPTTITVYSGGTAPKGTDLTEADIVTAAPSASVQLGSIGTVILSPLLGSPDRVWLSGPKMVEAHYSAGVTNDLVVKFHVRLFFTGDMRVRVIVENGTVNGTNAAQTYVPTVIIGGVEVYDNGGAPLTQYAHTRWVSTGWIGIADPGVTVAHDTHYLRETGLVPNYWKDGPSESTLNKLIQEYIPMAKGSWRENMANAGYHAQIGLLPNWEALYLNSGGDSRAYNSVIANTLSLNSYPIIWSDPSTDSPIVLDTWDTWSVYGENKGGATNWTAGDLKWDVAHHGSGGYLAYLITGDYYALTTMQYQAAMCYLVTWGGSKGYGTSRLIEPVQSRSVGWAVRTIGQLVSISPSDAITDDFSEMLDYSATHWATNDIDLNGLGIWHHFASGEFSGLGAMYRQFFIVQSFGYISDLEPLSSMTNFNAVRDFGYKSPIGYLGGNGPDSYCYTHAADPFVPFLPTGTNVSKDPDDFFDTFGEVWYENFGELNATCGDELTSYGSMSSFPGNAKGYWANLLPAIAYAVEDGASGAADSWTRLTNATNWWIVEDAGFEDIPIWGIVPRGSLLSHR